MMTGALLSDSFMPLDNMVFSTELLAASRMELTGMSFLSRDAGSSKLSDQLADEVSTVEWSSFASRSA